MEVPLYILFPFRHEPERPFEIGLQRSSDDRFPSNGSSPRDTFSYNSEPKDLRVRDIGTERDTKEVSVQ
jgi:hypothetical protein